ncbi:MAG: hypothetical protein MK193_03170 [Lentisphaeria bacterium]|nr:hypothetical protein [Lentisphaeria bacterium]
MSTKDSLIGDIVFESYEFEDVQYLFENAFKSEEFKKLTSQERFIYVCKRLYELITDAPDDSYLFVQFLNFLQRISVEEILETNFNQTGFEYWLNNLSTLSYEENRLIRAKLTGKYIPRERYQGVFPVGQGRVYQGSHTVTAHNPPDIDTMTASFWTWMDAFACRVGTALTVWNLPQGKPPSNIAKLFDDIFTENVFYRIAKSKTVLTHVALDLLTNKRMVYAAVDQSIHSFHKRRYENAVVLVDNQGFYLGDWRPGDADMVSQVQRLLTNCLHHYEEDFIKALTNIFAKKIVRLDECEQALAHLFQRHLLALDTYKLTPEESHMLDVYMKEVLMIGDGVNVSMDNFLQRMDEMTSSRFNRFKLTIEKFKNKDVYDNDSYLDMDVPEVFTIFHKAYEILTESIESVVRYLDRLDIAMNIKQIVLGHQPHYVTQRAEIAEVRRMMVGYRHLTVCFEGQDGRLTPLGVIHREDIDNPTQGTVSVRDFCNPNEINISGSLDIISVLDHHMTEISTTQAISINVADVQSSNTLMALKAFEMHDSFSTRNQNEDSIKKQLKKIQAEEPTSQNLRLIEKLIVKQRALMNIEKGYYVHPDRELQEYLCYLNAIIDDTDLLAKVCWRDLQVAAELINRIKSIMLGKEVEVVDVFDLGPDRREIIKAQVKILQNEDMYSFYKKIYEQKEGLVIESIQNVSQTTPKLSSIFADIKLQNTFNSVSQFKVFPNSWPIIETHRNDIMLSWQELSKDISNRNSNVDVFVQMFSTIPGAYEAYNQEKDLGDLEDQIWICVDTDREESVSHLRQLLTNFRSHPKLQQAGVHYCLQGQPGKKLNFTHNILKDFTPKGQVNVVENQEINIPIIIVHFQAGVMNSRKSDVTPYLPKLNN